MAFGYIFKNENKFTLHVSFIIVNCEFVMFMILHRDTLM